MGITLIFIRENKTTKHYLNADIDIIADTFGLFVMAPPIEMDRDKKTITIYLEHNNFGFYMQTLREQLGWKQTYLSEKTKLTPQYISQVENNKKTPKDTTLLKLLDAFFVNNTIEYTDSYSSTEQTTRKIREMSYDEEISKEEKQKEIEDDFSRQLCALQLAFNSIVDTEDLYLLALTKETVSLYRAFYNCLKADDKITTDNLIETIINKVENGLKQVRDEHHYLED